MDFIRRATGSLFVLACAVGCGAADTRVPAVAAPVATPAGSPTATGVSMAPPVDLPTVAPAKVPASWIVKEQVGSAAIRYLRVKGLVPRGAEIDPPAEADYVMEKEISEAEARASRLPVRTLAVPRFYTLGEPFRVELLVETDPPGATVYEVTSSGALVPLGKGPLRLELPGVVSDLKVTLLGSTSLVAGVPQEGISLRLWAALGDAVSSKEMAPVPMVVLAATDLDTLRTGTRSIAKHYAIRVREPAPPRLRERLRATISVEAP